MTLESGNGFDHINRKSFNDIFAWRNWNRSTIGDLTCFNYALNEIN